jgi:hypothetical protein
MGGKNPDTPRSEPHRPTDDGTRHTSRSATPQRRKTFRLPSPTTTARVTDSNSWTACIDTPLFLRLMKAKSPVSRASRIAETIETLAA